MALPLSDDPFGTALDDGVVLLEKFRWWKGTLEVLSDELKSACNGVGSLL